MAKIAMFLPLLIVGVISARMVVARGPKNPSKNTAIVLRTIITAAISSNPIRL